MQDVHKMMDILTSYIGASNIPNESDFIGIYGRVSTYVNASWRYMNMYNLISKYYNRISVPREKLAAGKNWDIF